MSDYIEQIKGISNKEAFLEFLYKLVLDFRNNSNEWENQSIDLYLEAMLSWIEDFSSSECNDIDWNTINYSTMAKILYMGKIYE